MITTTQISKQYIPTDPRNSFYFDIKYFNEEDINVTVVDSEGITTELVLNAGTNGFTVAPSNGDPDNGATVTTTSYYSYATVTIYRIVPITQENEFLRGGDIPPEVLNSSFDRGVAINQQIQSLVNRSITAPITDPDDLDYQFPSVAERANKYIGFDNNGNIIVKD